MSRAILTLPMMPIDGTNYGKFVTPIVGESLGNILGGKYYQCINLLDSFNDREKILNSYLESLKENKIYYDALWYDSGNVERLLENIQRLIDKGLIFEKKSLVYRCGCGIVEIEESKIGTCNPNNRKFRYEEGTMICKHCGDVCKSSEEKVLVFVPSKMDLGDIMVLPKYLGKDVKTYDNTVLKSYVTVSRKRETGIDISYKGTRYNLDIDFLWATYLSTFEEEEKIVVSGNRMLYQLFLVGVLEKCLCSSNKTILLGTPYITNIKEILSNSDFIDDSEFRKLVVLFSMKWQKKEVNYDESVLKYLKKMELGKRKQLYNLVNREIGMKGDFYNEVELVLRQRLNMQNCVKQLKLERR